MMNQICAVAGVVSMPLLLLLIASLTVWMIEPESCNMPEIVGNISLTIAIVCLCILIVGWCVIGSLAILNYAFSWGW